MTEPAATVTCPVCGTPSRDVRRGWCGKCEDWTGSTPCWCWKDVNGNLIPNEACELHWHQVADGGEFPPHLFP